MGKSVIIATNSGEFAEQEINKLRQELGIKPDNIPDQLIINIPEDKMSIGISQMQELKSWSKTRPYDAAAKLAVINNAEVLTNEAQNSILKLLEEPNKDNNYVLVTSNYGKLLPTVLSRCELINDNLARVGKEDLSEFLKGDDLDRYKYLERFEKYKTSAEKNAAMESFLVSLLIHCRQKMLSVDASEHEVRDCLESINTISTVKKMQDARVPGKSALGYLIVNVKIPREMV